MYRIPEITDKVLDELRVKIRPVAKFAKGSNGLFANDNGFLHYILITGHPRTTTFFWEISAGDKCKKLNPLKKIETHHGTGGFFFKPSEAEVLAQIPKEILDSVVAYEIIDYNITDNQDDSIASVQLYKK